MSADEDVANLPDLPALVIPQSSTNRGFLNDIDLSFIDRQPGMNGFSSLLGSKTEEAPFRPFAFLTSLPPEEDDGLPSIHQVMDAANYAHHEDSPSNSVYVADLHNNRPFDTAGSGSGFNHNPSSPNEVVPGDVHLPSIEDLIKPPAQSTSESFLPDLSARVNPAISNPFASNPLPDIRHPVEHPARSSLRSHSMDAVDLPDIPSFVNAGTLARNPTVLPGMSGFSLLDEKPPLQSDKKPITMGDLDAITLAKLDAEDEVNFAPKLNQRPFINDVRLMELDAFLDYFEPKLPDDPDAKGWATTKQFLVRNGQDMVNLSIRGKRLEHGDIPPEWARGGATMDALPGCSMSEISLGSDWDEIKRRNLQIGSMVITNHLRGRCDFGGFHSGSYRTLVRRMCKSFICRPHAYADDSFRLEGRWS